MPMPVSAWLTDSAFLRFQGWSYNPDDSGATGIRLSHWVYVNSDDLVAFCAALDNWRSGLPEWNGEDLPEESADYLCGYPVRLVPYDDDLLDISPPSLREIGLLNIVTSAASEPKPKKKTKPKPKWYEMLRGEFIKEHERRLEWPDRHPNDLPPAFPTAAWFRRKLIERGWTGINEPRRTTLEYHHRALREEFER